eukprot:766376-Hanusia_phi.AAC.2
MKWVHITVLRVHKPCSGSTLPCCTSSYANPAITVEYQVYVNGESVYTLEHSTVSNLMCAPSCGWESCNTLPIDLHFGYCPCSGGGAGSESGMYFSGQLDEWRVWNGFRTQVQIQDLMKTSLTVDKEGFLGNPTSIQINQYNYISNAAILLLYSMDYTCPDSAGSQCAVSQMYPVYPTNNQPWSLATATAIFTVNTDSTGAMLWETAIDTMGIMSMSSSRVRVNPVKGPGFYQASMMLSFSNGTGLAPVDFLIHVVNATYDSEKQAYKLCGCAPYVGNSYIPKLRVLAKVAPWNGNFLMYSPYLTQYKDITDFTYPSFIQIVAGYHFNMQFYGVDFVRPNEVSTVSFLYTSSIPEMRFSLSNQGNSSTLEASWTPCRKDVGSHVICVSAIDCEGPTVASATSQMQCVKIEVIASASPQWYNFSSDSYTLYMGKLFQMGVQAFENNMLASVSIALNNKLPYAVLKSLVVNQVSTTANSVTSSSEFSWTPAHDMGAFSGLICFSAVDDGAACPLEQKQRQSATKCVLLTVIRCQYTVRQGQQLQEIATIFSNNWMNLWSLNSNIRHPDFLPDGGEQIYVGHMYRALKHDTIGTVAKRMGMTRDQIALLNWDLRSKVNMSIDFELVPNQEICVIPDSCKGMTATVYSSLTFADPKSLAEQLIGV